MIITSLILSHAAHATVDLNAYFQENLLESTESGGTFVDSLEVTNPALPEPTPQSGTATVTSSPMEMTIDISGFSEILIRETDDEGGIAPTDEIPLSATLEQRASDWLLIIDADNGSTLETTFTEQGEVLTESDAPSWDVAAEIFLFLVEIEARGPAHFSSPPPIGVIYDIVVPEFVGPPPQ